jgi:hypothetical protein
VSPVLDIGGDVGAIVVYLPDRPPSGELEAEPVASVANRLHTGVHRRVVGSGPAWVAVFPEVRTGTYDLLDEQAVPFARVTVEGGGVTELDAR